MVESQIFIIHYEYCLCCLYPGLLISWDLFGHFESCQSSLKYPGYHQLLSIVTYHRNLVYRCIQYLAPLQWRHNEHDDVSYHQPHHCLLNRLFMHISKKTSKLRVTGLCEGNSPVTGEYPAQRASDAELWYSFWWHHHVIDGRPWTIDITVVIKLVPLIFMIGTPKI